MYGEQQCVQFSGETMSHATFVQSVAGNGMRENVYYLSSSVLMSVWKTECASLIPRVSMIA